MVQVVATKFAGIRKTLEFDFDFDWRRGWRPRRNCWRGLRLRAIFRAAATSEKFLRADTLLHISLDPLFGGRGSKREFLTGALVDRAMPRRRGRPSMYL